MGDGILFSYASPDDPVLRRIAIRTIERLTGRPRLQRMYSKNQRHPRAGETFWDAAVRELELRVKYDETRLRAIPAIGPAVIVANHPFGVLDGIVISHLVAKIRTDFKLLTNSVLCRTSELRPHLLPIDFAPTPAARATNLRSRADALSWLCAGGALVVFPGRAVATSERMFARHAVDPAWKLFTAKAIRRAGATVVPMFFEAEQPPVSAREPHQSGPAPVAAVQRGVQQDRQRGRGPHRRPGALCGTQPHRRAQGIGRPSPAHDLPARRTR